MTLRAIILVGRNFLREEVTLAIAFWLSLRSLVRTSGFCLSSVTVIAGLSCRILSSMRTRPSYTQSAAVFSSKVSSLFEFEGDSLPPFDSSIVFLAWSLLLLRRFMRCGLVPICMCCSSCRTLSQYWLSCLISSRACCLCASSGLLSRLAISQSNIVRSLFYSSRLVLRSSRTDLMPFFDFRGALKYANREL